MSLTAKGKRKKRRPRPTKRTEPRAIPPQVVMPRTLEQSGAYWTKLLETYKELILSTSNDRLRDWRLEDFARQEKRAKRDIDHQIRDVAQEIRALQAEFSPMPTRGTIGDIENYDA
jgi:hypothetical protein